MKDVNPVALLNLVSTITHDAMISQAPEYKELIDVASQATGTDVPRYVATFRYLHSNLSDLLMSASSDNN